MKIGQKVLKQSCFYIYFLPIKDNLCKAVVKPYTSLSWHYLRLKYEHTQYSQMAKLTYNKYIYIINILSICAGLKVHLHSKIIPLNSIYMLPVHLLALNMFNGTTQMYKLYSQQLSFLFLLYKTFLGDVSVCVYSLTNL